MIGIAHKLTDAELLTLAVLQALLGFTSEARFIRHAHTHLDRGCRPCRTGPATTNASDTRARCSNTSSPRWLTARACPSWNDDLSLVDSTPVECGRSRDTVKRSVFAGWATYGYRA